MRCRGRNWHRLPVGITPGLRYTEGMDEERSVRRMAILFAGILVAFKAWTLLLILVFSSSWETVQFLAANHVLWFAVAAVLLWGPALFWFRLVRLRARRRALIRSEWEVEDSQRLYR